MHDNRRKNASFVTSDESLLAFVNRGQVAHDRHTAKSALKSCPGEVSPQGWSKLELRIVIETRFRFG